jgi:DNA replication protein DnaC
VVVPEFLDHLRKTFNPESKVSYDQLFEAVKTAPLLVLDDSVSSPLPLGAGKALPGNQLPL